MDSVQGATFKGGSRLSNRVNIQSRTPTPLSEKPNPEAFQLLAVGSDNIILMQKAKALVQQVAVEEKGWPIGDYIDRYAETSKLFVVSTGERVVGVVLIVEGERSLFPIRSNDAWPELLFPPGSSAEIPFVLVDKEFRGSSGVSYILCAACHWYFSAAGIDYMELTLDRQLLEFYLWHGMEMKKVPESQGGGEKEHWGESGIFPAQLYVGDPEIPGSMGFCIKEKRPEMWQVFLRHKP